MDPGKSAETRLRLRTCALVDLRTRCLEQRKLGSHLIPGVHPLVVAGAPQFVDASLYDARCTLAIPSAARAGIDGGGFVRCRMHRSTLESLGRARTSQNFHLSTITDIWRSPAGHNSTLPRHELSTGLNFCGASKMQCPAMSSLGRRGADAQRRLPVLHTLTSCITRMHAAHLCPPRLRPHAEVRRCAGAALQVLFLEVFERRRRGPAPDHAREKAS
jgi:hypothetical protein